MGIIVITGGSRGIGASAAELASGAFGPMPCPLALSARNEVAVCTMSSRP
jgi:short-subunit dehydrogenase